MSSFNLVPPAYLRRRQMVRDVRMAIALSLLLVLGALGVYAWLSHTISVHRGALAQLEASRTHAKTTRAEMAELARSKAQLEARYALLQGLKGTVSARQLLAAIDAALSADIVFEWIRFERAGEPIERADEGLPATYIQILNDVEGALQGRFNAVKIETGITLRGRTNSHSSMAGFMTRLAEQPVFERVSLLRSGGKEGVSTDGVMFELSLGIRHIPGDRDAG